VELADIARQIAQLPPEAQQQVADFVAFLRVRHAARRGRVKPGRTPLGDEPFVGMWRDREEMREGGAWVRAFREREWRVQPQHEHKD